MIGRWGDGERGRFFVFLHQIGTQNDTPKHLA